MILTFMLSWPLNGFAKIPIPGRRQPKHTFLSFAEKAAEEGSDIDHAWDDELEINTQSSSQWDSFCHYAHQHTGRNYNGAKATREKLSADPTENDRLPTLENWHSRGCVVGRGVLLDFKAYAEAVGKEYEPFGSSYITAEELDACAVHQGVEFHPGDVLLIRTGQTEFVEDSSAEELGKALVKGHFSGLNGAEETARWLWNKRFAAVASDSLALEAYPPRGPDGKSNPAGNLSMCARKISRGVMKLIGHSSSRIHAFLLWHANWRALGFEAIGRVLPKGEALFFHDHVGTIEPPALDRISAECTCYPLSLR
jgi:kynurenine formamidase